MRYSLRHPVYLLLFLATIAFSSGQLFAQPVPAEIKRAIENAPSAKDYPQAGALILFDRLKLTVHSDGSKVSERHLLVKIFTDRGKEEFGDLIQRYDSKTQRVEVEIARTFKPDGTILQCEKDAISDVSAPEVTNASAYSNAMEKVASFPAVEKNAVLEYKCKVFSKKKKSFFQRILHLFLRKRQDKYFWGAVSFQGEEPILEKSFTLVLPRGRRFTYMVENGEIKPQVNRRKDEVIYLWKVTRMGQIIREPQMPSLAEIVPRMLLTSADSWSEVGKWLRDKFYPQIKIDKQLRNKVQELTAGEMTPAEKTEKIFLYVTTKFRTVHLNLGAAGYAPNSSVEVYQNRYGDCRDKAVLLVAMLKAAGIKAYPALVNRSWVPVVSKVPGPHQFDHLIVAVPQKNNSFLWLDPTAENCRYGYLPPSEQGTEALVLLPKGARLIKTPIFSPAENGAENQWEITLDEKGDIVGNLRCALQGYSDYRARCSLKDKTPKELELYFQGVASQISQGARLIDYSLSDLKDLTQPASVEIHFRCEGYAVTEGNVMLFELPPVPFGFAGISISTDLPERRYAILAPSRMESSYNIKINLPKGYKLSYLPSEVLMDNDTAFFSLNCEKGSKQAVIQKKLILKKRTIPSSEYTKVKTPFTQAVMPQNNLMILERL